MLRRWQIDLRVAEETVSDCFYAVRLGLAFGLLAVVLLFVAG
ncbi:MAG TPA: hypothetical protein VIQ62_07365 [Burkholderiales bacterium]